MQFRIGNRAALYAHPLPAESGISRQQSLVRLAVDHILPRIPRRRYVARADYRRMLHHHGRSHPLRVCCRSRRSLGKRPPPPKSLQR